MADQMTPPEKSPEEIEREMHATREALTEKVTALENQVVGTVQTAADTFTHTVEAVKSFVAQAPETVNETVKQASAAVNEAFKGTFDISRHVRENPWAAVGISALLGGIVGALTASRRREFSPFAEAGPMPAAAHTAVAAPSAPSSPSRPGILDGLTGLVGGQLKDIVETALTSLSAAVKSSIETNVPKLVDEATSALTDRDAGEPPVTLAAQFDARRTQGS
ncbi:MAG TPA: DUF883 C-terminal domain-containing protein [Gemmata sp.]